MSGDVENTMAAVSGSTGSGAAGGAGGQGDDRRIRREKRTVRAMVAIYCAAKHGCPGELCDACRALLDYSYCRLDQCPYGGEKPTCAKCPIHCYRPHEKARMKDLMRFSGPRMTLRHPWLAFWHLVDSLRSKISPAGRPGRKRDQDR